MNAPEPVTVMPTLSPQGLRTLDREFGRWVAERFAGDGEPQVRALVEQLACAVSFALHLKHSCLDLDKAATLGEPVLDQLLQPLPAAAVRELPQAAVAAALRRWLGTGRTAGALG